MQRSNLENPILIKAETFFCLDSESEIKRKKTNIFLLKWDFYMDN